jgi:hypothetical protein
MEMTMTMSLEAAAQAMREAMRETVKRHSLWYLVQGGLMILAGILALILCVPKIRFCNIGDEGRRGQAVM